jgi:hypothetical protein
VQCIGQYININDGILGFSSLNITLKQGVYITLYHGLAIYTEVTFVNVTLVEAVPSGSRPAVV